MDDLGDLDAWGDPAPIPVARRKRPPARPDDGPTEGFLGASLLIGGGIAAIAHVASATAYERLVIPTLPAAEKMQMHTYGIQFGIAFLFVGALGGSAGLVAVALRYPRYWIALLVPAIASFLVADLSRATWRDSIAQDGRDPSDMIVFVPPLIASGLTMGLVLGACAVLFLRWWVSRSDRDFEVEVS